ncbi:PRELID1 [Branchiostoma lanceolatum]|uniref:PRELID1 protein n=1 Tax=Branchiostoma lanceolatum TaxID=7740 RepID=A0A8J9ZR90_BRALA|nr:PRELID1 [Branchiostoma lanceolatum]
MARYHSKTTVLQNDWDQVASAVWQRYPNPHSKHVLSEDVISRKIEDNKLHSFRLLTKTNHLPKWGERFLPAGTPKFASIVEESVVDPVAKTFTTFTWNLNFTRIMHVREKVVYSVSPENNDWTQIHREAWVSSGMYGFIRAIQHFGVDRYKKNAEKANMGLRLVLDKLFNKGQEVATEQKPVEKKGLLKEKAKVAKEAAIQVAQQKAQQKQGTLM